jgi:hypothetical protein
LDDIDKATDRYPHRILMRIKSTEAERREALPPNCPASCDSDSVLYAPLRNLHVLASSLPQLAVASRIRSVGARLRLQPGGAKERKAPSALMHSSFLSRRETSAAERLPQISKRTDRILFQ